MTCRQTRKLQAAEEGARIEAEAAYEQSLKATARANTLREVQQQRASLEEMVHPVKMIDEQMVIKYLIFSQITPVSDALTQKLKAFADTHSDSWVCRHQHLQHLSSGPAVPCIGVEHSRCSAWCGWAWGAMPRLAALPASAWLLKMGQIRPMLRGIAPKA